MPIETNNPEAPGTGTDANGDPNLSTPGRYNEKPKADASLTWQKATRDAWNCLEKARPSDGDGNSR